MGNRRRSARESGSAKRPHRREERGLTGEEGEKAAPRPQHQVAGCARDGEAELHQGALGERPPAELRLSLGVGKRRGLHREERRPRRGPEHQWRSRDGRRGVHRRGGGARRSPWEDGVVEAEARAAALALARREALDGGQGVGPTESGLGAEFWGPTKFWGSSRDSAGARFLA